MRTARFLVVLLVLTAFTAWAGTVRAAAGDKAAVAIIEIEGAVPERHATVGLAGMTKGAATLREYVDAIDAVAGETDLSGLVLKLTDAALKPSQVEELGLALQRVRAAGKRVHVYSYFYDTAELLLGSYADEVIAQAGSAVSLPGLHVEEMYLADTLAWAGVKADFVQIGDYKGASETLVNARPSKAWEENIEQLLDGMYAAIRTQIKAGRRLDDARLDSAMEKVWEATADDAKAAGLVDTVLDLPDLDAHLARAYGKEIAWRDDLLASGDGAALDTANPFALFSMLMSKKERAITRPTIAVLHIDGAIVDGDSTPGGFLGDEASVGSLTIRRALAEIEESPLVKGLIVRIDSPGGSAVASEVIWRGIRRVRDAGKPVWASVGSMAASGGYYIAVAGDKIYLTPSSIVGSIGVVGGKLALGGLYEKFKLNTVSRGRGPRHMMAASAQPWSESERALVRAQMKQTYDLFASRVSAGRKGIDLGATAEGRLFAGEKAIALKMADTLGGLDTAVDDLSAALALAPGSFDVLDFPAPKGLDEVLEDLLGGFGMSAAARTGRQPLAASLEAGLHSLEQLAGPESAASLRASARALWQLRSEPVLLLSPRVLTFR